MLDFRRFYELLSLGASSAAHQRASWKALGWDVERPWVLDQPSPSSQRTICGAQAAATAASTT